MALSIAEETNGRAVFSASGDTVFLKGEIDSLDPGEYLAPFFTKVHEQMDSIVKLNFAELEFLNSSGIKQIVTFIMNRNPESSVVFITDNTRTWQRTSLEVIQSLDEEKISIEDVS